MPPRRRPPKTAVKKTSTPAEVHSHEHAHTHDADDPHVHHTCPRPGPITLANARGFEYREMSENYIGRAMSAFMSPALEKEFMKRKNGLGSATARWYRRVADREALKPGPERLVAWKPNTDFTPANVFVRASDTGRMLCMHLGPCRIRFYSLPSDFAQWDTRSDADGLQANLARLVATPLMAVRSFIDSGGADFPVIMVKWPIQEMHMAMKFWCNSSKGIWTEEEEKAQFKIMHDTLHRAHATPCFHAVDHLLRAILLDPEIGYIPLYILFLNPLGEAGVNGTGGSLILFTDARAVPPAAVMRDYPMTCCSPGCPSEDGCGAVEIPKNGLEDAYVLTRRLGGMVRDPDDPFHFGPSRKLCNLWGCEVEEDDLLRCSRCQTVGYCGQMHQKLYWPTHKRFCEKRAA